MALTVDVLFKDTIGSSRACVLADITFDASYPTGGEALTPAQLQLDAVDAVFAENADGFVVEYDRSAEKVKVFRGANVSAKGDIAGQDEASDNTYTVTGIATSDELVAVWELATAASVATVTDRTADFSISAANEISGDGATNRTNNELYVIWQSKAGGEVASTTDLSATPLRLFAIGRG